MNNFRNYLDSNLVNESSLSRIYQNLNNKDMCMIAISADRDEIDDPIEKEMRQKDLAEKSGVSPMCISNVINGHVVPRVDTIVYLAEALEMDVGELITK